MGEAHQIPKEFYMLAERIAKRFSARAWKSLSFFKTLFFAHFFLKKWNNKYLENEISRRRRDERKDCEPTNVGETILSEQVGRIGATPPKEPKAPRAGKFLLKCARGWFCEAKLEVETRWIAAASRRRAVDMVWADLIGPASRMWACAGARSTRIGQPFWRIISIGSDYLSKMKPSLRGFIKLE